MVQDGTIFNLKSKYDNVNEFVNKRQILIEDITDKFTPEMIVVCELTPIINNEESNTRVEKYNDYLNDT